MPRTILTVIGLLLAIMLLPVNAEAKGPRGSSHASAPRASKPAATKASTTPVHVKQFVKPSTGKVVEAHARTAPNKTQKDNWSAKPNTNPNTGKPGTKTPTK